jgi:predicted nucleotide-binding protein
MFLMDLQAVAHRAWSIVGEGDSLGGARHKVDLAWLQGFGESLASVQSWVIEHGDPFSENGVAETQLLARLDVLHLSVKKIIDKSDRLVVHKYFERAADIVGILSKKPGIDPGILDIEFMLETLRMALEDSQWNTSENEPNPAPTVSPGAPKKRIGIFIAAGNAGEDAAEQLALMLDEKVGSNTTNVVRSWTRLAELGVHPLPGMITAIHECQYGALVLHPEEVTVRELADSGRTPGNRHLRLPVDLEFMLGVMTGILNIENTFLVMPETAEAELSSLLVGLVLAKYDPTEADDHMMNKAASRIRYTISRRKNS